MAIRRLDCTAGWGEEGHARLAPPAAWMSATRQECAHAWLATTISYSMYIYIKLYFFISIIHTHYIQHKKTFFILCFHILYV
jgi:hypothetical protein